jgi:myo-inositol catabolism protein IolS
LSRTNQYLEEAAETMRELQKEGKVQAIGQSAYSYADFMRVCPVTPGCAAVSL